MSVSNKSRKLGKCLVCDADATAVNFGVVTCAACKAFFRRNAVKLGRIDFVCEVDGDCPMLPKSRRICTCCRLAKCFRVGMNRSLILSEAEKGSRRDVIQQNREKRMQIVEMKRLGWIRPSNLLCSTCSQTKQLSASDRTLLTNIISIHERTCGIEKMNYHDFPMNEHSSLHTFFNEYKDRHMGVIQYFKLIPEFNRLSMDDKTRIVQNHFPTMCGIHEPILNRNVSHKLLNSFKKMFPSDVAADLIRSFNLIFFYANDLTLLRLVLTVQSLSSGIKRYRGDKSIDGIYDDTQAIFAGQTVYVELLWRYILSRSSSEGDAVKFLNKLMRDLLFLQSKFFMADCYIFGLEDELSQMEPLMQSMWPQPNKVEINDDYDIDM